MNNRERRDNEMPYISDTSVLSQQFKTKFLLKSYNRMLPFNIPKAKLLFKLMGIRYSGLAYMEPPFRCEYGNHIELGKDFYANTNCVIIDVGKVKIGDNVMFGPNVSVITAGHPVHPVARKSAYEYGIPVTIGNNVWLGAGVIVLPGVNIGDNVVIGAGSVVTKDIPPNAIAVGNPCRVLREITNDDIHYYFKKRKFDEKAAADIEKLMAEEK